MSGTSLDGVDLAFCSFSRKSNEWKYEILAAETVKYPESWARKLSDLENSTALDFAETDFDYGYYLGELCKTFLRAQHLEPDFIASHGHTIFHNPAKKITYQIGKGACIAAIAEYPVISDFRSLDVALGGQGAPLVPVGDMLLFKDFDYCLNLGGFGNVSFDEGARRIAFDVCPVNIVLNHYARLNGKEYDINGEMARTGNIHPELLASLNELAYYHTSAPKSLGKEWVLAEFMPVTGKYDIPVADQLRTVCEHIAIQVGKIIKPGTGKKMLITGGGAFNEFLIERIRQQVSVSVIIPDPLTINYKEALIFAFLGVLRWTDKPNCLKSVTGASKDNTGGSIFSS